MKKLTLLAIIGMAGASIYAQDAINAPVTHRRALAPVSPAQHEGAIQRGVRLGNPAQMLNPLAPVEYGDGQDFLAPRDYDPNARPLSRNHSAFAGFRLFNFAF